ncbi:hypothetical protein ASG01_14770 [Chryseobacterium sp. Leaf180]|uniref:hypothetical protein n=1 Tax=Chryseobacterium sp. Leaf180 TaxID=1736289 RepID=UPI0006FC99BF|nr:hypothetical protein [Chryseobacterium sp. Leaf180]KQR90825.1 hypothetical protein ASG01_14770 [Chryseobacterium sp. Leaf180]
MSLEKFYGLREDFIILGLTGKMQAGADKVVEILKAEKISETHKNFLQEFPNKYKLISNTESLKYKKVGEFYKYDGNWKQFKIIEYKDVILLFILHACYSTDLTAFSRNIANLIIELGTFKNNERERFGSTKGIAQGSKEFIQEEFTAHLNHELEKLTVTDISAFTKGDLADALKTDNLYFSDEYQTFARAFFYKLDSFSIYLRHMLIHVASYRLRLFGNLKTGSEEGDIEKLSEIYKIAEVINSIIKAHRKNTGKAHIIIDRLKNSYEMLFFREKYSGFYMVSLNREDNCRYDSIREKISEIRNAKTDTDENFKRIKELDQTEYLVSEFKKGEFESFDIENCVQKADYHIWYDEKYSDINFYDKFEKEDKILKFDKDVIEGMSEYYVYQPLLIQILKLTALIKLPGLITPTYPERIMQIAYNAKLNSGCISRQVGAVVTDKNFSVKGIGWNEVGNGQIPCSSRDIRDYEKSSVADNNGYTKFELGETDHKYKDGKSFREKMIEDIEKINIDLDDNLKGRTCSFCFKSHHNSYEAKDNQVHTRSLHAEENAMLQISKYGGQPLQGGNLFTTASTCELCAKKAYQLGVKNIFYIDVYPGISNDQILKNGTHRPNLFAFEGVIGRAFNKLYEPFMSQKDELHIRTKFKPTITQTEQASQIQHIIGSKISNASPKLKEYLNKMKDDPIIIEKIVALMDKGINSDEVQ